LHLTFLNEPLTDFAIEIGWEPYNFGGDPDLLFAPKKPVAQVIRERLIPH
jgi:hypothetical protein